MQSRSRASAFTLIELLIVIAIIGLAATIAVAALSSARAKARDSKRVTDLKQMQKALELSYDPSTGYPVVSSPIALGGPTTDVLCTKGTVSAFVADQSAANCDTGKVYMGLVPSNPSPNGATYMYRSANNSGTVCTTAPCLGYCIQSTLEAGQPQNGLTAGTVIVDQTALKNGTCP